MTAAQRLSGPTHPISRLLRWAFAVGAAVIGLFVFAVSATFLLFAVLAVVVVALIGVGVYWARARLTGRPFGPREHLAAMMEQMDAGDAAFRTARPATVRSGPVIDAHRTPDGWSVDG